MLANSQGSTVRSGQSVERQTELTAESLWDDVSARLREALNDTTYSTWFGEVDGLALADETFAVAVPNDFTREWIESHFLDLIRAAVKDAAGKPLRVHLQVVEPLLPPAAVAAAPNGTGLLHRHALAPRTEIAGINPKYTFDSFVIGSSNRFAHAAALAVAEAPAQ